MPLLCNAKDNNNLLKNDRSHVSYDIVRANILRTVVCKLPHNLCISSPSSPSWLYTEFFIMYPLPSLLIRLIQLLMLVLGLN